MTAAQPLVAPMNGTSMVSNITLAMMHHAPDGISEQWLLRACGDRHWSMIADAMGQDTAVFADAEGRSVYAAFCATELWLAPASCYLGQHAKLTSTLFELSGAVLGSEHEVVVDSRPVARLRMQSSFVGHDESATNKRIVRRMPVGRLDLPPATAELASLSDRARTVARHVRRRKAEGKPTMTVTPCPALDFNAVGLLYFPTFSALAERVESQRGLAGPLCCRTVVYTGNLDPGDQLQLFSPNPFETDLVRSDGRIIGRSASQRYPLIAGQVSVRDTLTASIDS